VEGLMSRLPAAVLYVCSLNRVRSPMAAGLTRKLYGEAMRVESCGLEPSEFVDPLAAVVMGEIGVELFDHAPKAFADMRPDDFDLVVALSLEAQAVTQMLCEAGAEVEAWSVSDPAVEEGSRDMRLEAYRQTRKELETLITQRFGPPAEWE
jgi:protein-tyrosine-phosphatase